MSIFILNLKNEHMEILKILKKVQSLNIHSDEGRKKMMSARDLLMAHLKKEDKKLYPVLKKEASNNKHLKYKLAQFIENIDEITKKIIHFFDVYSADITLPRLTIDYENLLVILAERIESEEKLLYPEYEKLLPRNL